MHLLSVCLFSCTDSSHSSSSSTRGERLSAKMRSLPGSNEPYETSSPKELGENTSPSLFNQQLEKHFCMTAIKINLRSVNLFLSCADASYVDPLGPQMERPKTGAKKRVEDDDFADEELGDDLLPE